MKTITNKHISLGLGQTRPIRSANGEHIATSQGKARTRSQWRSSERTTRVPWGGPETSEHDGVGCHKGEALISNMLFGAREAAVLAPASTCLPCFVSARVYPTGRTGVVLGWSVEATWEYAVGYWVEQEHPKKRLFLWSPSKWLDTILLGCDGDKSEEERQLEVSEDWLTVRDLTSLLSVREQQGEEMEACEELALALTRGLQLDTQRSSRDSLQCSSGYSTQTTTPCCSEDTIPSQGTRPRDVLFQSFPSLTIIRSPLGAKEMYSSSYPSLPL